MLRIAIPNKGQLADPTQKMLREAGYLRSHHPRDLVVSDPENDVEFFFLRPEEVLRLFANLHASPVVITLLIPYFSQNSERI